MLFEFGDFVLDESSYELRQRGASVRVDKKVFPLLAYMVRRPGRLVTRDEPIEHVWDGRTLSETVLSGAITRVRKVLGNDEKLVVNVLGVGYRFTGSVKRPSTPERRSGTERLRLPTRASPAGVPKYDAEFAGASHFLTTNDLGTAYDAQSKYMIPF